MTLAVMQPYVFPYLGYYQLVKAVDTFVFFDDVNFINKGWINRNQLLQQDKPVKFTIPLSKASQNKMIGEIELSGFKSWRENFLKCVEMNYKKAPYFSSVFNWLDKFFFLKDYLLISELAAESIKSVANILELPTRFKNSSTLNYKSGTKQNGSQKVINICNILGAKIYINPKNGIELYNRQQFELENIQLNFIDMHPVNYLQFKSDCFVQNLSIIDVLMFNSKEKIRNMLTQYELI